MRTYQLYFVYVCLSVRRHVATLKQTLIRNFPGRTVKINKILILITGCPGPNINRNHPEQKLVYFIF